jgi:hypothetical protein
MSGSPPAAPLVFVLIGLVEVVITAVGVFMFSSWWRSAGPGAQYGLAARHEVRSVLGRRELGRRRGAVRPDLVGSQGPRNPHSVGWRLRRSSIPRGVEARVPFDRPAGVYGPQGRVSPWTSSPLRCSMLPGRHVRPAGPLIGGALQSLALGLPLVVAGVVKGGYDLALWSWAHTTPPRRSATPSP